jgi:glutathione S-transferase
MWGTPHSLYSGKARSYLIKKRVPFTERLASDPRFLGEVVPAIGHMVIPVVETPEGELIQDTSAIIDHVEARIAEPVLHPPGPVQQVVAHFLDAFGSNYLLPAAMHYRWSYRDEQERFLCAEFTRAVPPVMPYAQRQQMALAIMARFNGFLPNLGVTPETIPAIEQAYEELLDVLELHFQAHPYLLGGMPSLADFGMMGPLYAHLARDPVPARLMRTRAPNVARWTERMNQAELADDEFPGSGQGFAADDALPETLEAVLKLAFALWQPGLAADLACFDAWVAELDDPAPGTIVSRDGARQVHPNVGRIDYAWRGTTVRRASHVHSLWHLARAQDLAGQLGGEDAARLTALLERTGGAALMALRPRRPIRREANVLVLD